METTLPPTQPKVLPIPEKAVLRPGTDPNRVPDYWRHWPNEWQAEYDMLLPDGVTCESCAHVNRCTTLFGQKASSNRCQFAPSRFYAKPTNQP